VACMAKRLGRVLDESSRHVAWHARFPATPCMNLAPPSFRSFVLASSAQLLSAAHAGALDAAQSQHGEECGLPASSVCPLASTRTYAHTSTQLYMHAKPAHAHKTCSCTQNLRFCRAALSTRPPRCWRPHCLDTAADWRRWRSLQRERTAWADCAHRC
jgi:hypothetical protein